MGDLMLFRASDHLGEGMLEDAEKFVGHFRFAPEKTLQTLHPLEVGNDHSSGVAENVRNDKDLIPALLQDQIRFRRGWAVRGFGENAALQLARIADFSRAAFADDRTLVAVWPISESAGARVDD